LTTPFPSLLEQIELKTGQIGTVNKVQSQSFASVAQVCTPEGMVTYKISTGHTGHLALGPVLYTEDSDF